MKTTVKSLALAVFVGGAIGLVALLAEERGRARGFLDGRAFERSAGFNAGRAFEQARSGAVLRSCTCTDLPPGSLSPAPGGGPGPGKQVHVLVEVPPPAGFMRQ
jgi:hypothetical protein